MASCTLGDSACRRRRLNALLKRRRTSFSFVEPLVICDHHAETRLLMPTIRNGILRVQARVRTADLLRPILLAIFATGYPNV
jgi:hypothetical protein